MNRREARARRKERGELLAAAWGIAIVPNLLIASGFNPDSWGWLALRIALSVVFAVALCAWLAALIRERRAPAASP